MLDALLITTATLLALAAAAVAWSLNDNTTTVLDKEIQAPVLLVSSTFHSRFKPILHSFRYPVLYLCVDLDSIGYVDRLFTTTRKAWRLLSLDSGDYLGARYTGSIKEKLFQHLKDHDIDTSNLRRSLLVTTPRLFGYSFNPVSFHYIYDYRETLKVVVLEVNNTFGEKHIYVLNQDDALDPVRKGYSSAQTFPRKFHVSPFNDRKGSYTLQCADPRATPEFRVDMHLTLLDEQGRKKLTAQVNSTRPALPTTHLALTIWILLKYGTAVFLTMPRILWQAYSLHYAKKLSVYMRPEPLEDLGAIGRQSMSSTDLYFRNLWLAYLKSIAEWIPVKTVSLTILSTGECLKVDGAGQESLDIVILSTTFFSSLATSESALTLLWTESLSLQTPVFRVSDPVLFLRVFGAGFTGRLPGRRYLQDYRVKYRGRAEWFNDNIQRFASEYAEFLTLTNRGLDNFVHDKALKSELSLWHYKYKVIMSLWSGWLGNKVFSTIATFTELTGPQDEWARVKAALEQGHKSVSDDSHVCSQSKA